jgi:ribose transport system substrate-binding protein
MRRRALLLSAAALAACRRSGKPVVGVVPKGANHIFWQTVHAGALQAASEYGFDVEWNAPTLEVDSSRQIEIVESMVNRRLAGIVLAPVDRTALVNVVERAAKANIPVSIFDSAIDTTHRLTYVATNNREGGRMAARRIGEILGGKGKVGVIGFMPGSASTMEREDGFTEEMKAKFPGIVMAGMQFGMANRAKAMAATENMMAAHPDLSAFFADNESSSSGAVQALKSRNARNVKLVAFDASEQLVNDLRDGWIDALIVQNPFKMGYESAKAIGEKLAGRTPAAEIDSGVKLVTAPDLRRSEIRELLLPDLSRWLKPARAH